MSSHLLQMINVSSSEFYDFTDQQQLSSYYEEFKVATSKLSIHGYCTHADGSVLHIIEGTKWQIHHFLELEFFKQLSSQKRTLMNHSNPSSNLSSEGVIVIDTLNDKKEWIDYLARYKHQLTRNPRCKKILAPYYKAALPNIENPDLSHLIAESLGEPYTNNKSGTIFSKHEEVLANDDLPNSVNQNPFSFPEANLPTNEVTSMFNGSSLSLDAWPHFYQLKQNPPTPSAMELCAKLLAQTVSYNSLLEDNNFSDQRNLDDFLGELNRLHLLKVNKDETNHFTINASSLKEKKSNKFYKTMKKFLLSRT